MLNQNDNLSPTSRNVAIEPILLNANQAAQLLGIGRTLVFELNSTGMMPRAIRLGGAVRWNKPELEAWAAAGAPPRERWEAMNKSRRSGQAKDGRS